MSVVWTLEIDIKIHRRVLLELRRTNNELERAREEFQRARAEFTNTLDTWSREEQRRDADTNKKLDLSVQRLQAIGGQCVQKAIDETIRVMSETVRMLTIWPTNSKIHLITSPSRHATQLEANRLTSWFCRSRKPWSFPMKVNKGSRHYCWTSCTNLS